MISTSMMLEAVLLLLACSQHCISAAKIRILHYNDNHARVEPQDLNFNTCTNSSQCFGGYAKQKTLIDQERSKSTNRREDIILVHAGDVFSGAVKQWWDVVYTSKGNFSAVSPFLSAQHLDAFTFGNHEFDYGPHILASFLNNTKESLPFTSCNVDVSKEPSFNSLNITIPRFIIKILPYSGITVGFIGFTTPNTTQSSIPGKNIIFHQPTAVAAQCIADARSAGASFIIAVNHLGYEVDKQFAAHPSTRGIHMIVGGHSHSFLYNGDSPPIILPPQIRETHPVDGLYPTIVNNISIVQAMFGSRYMGVLDVDIDGTSVQYTRGGSQQQQPVLLGDIASSNYVLDDADTAAYIVALRKEYYLTRYLNNNNDDDDSDIGYISRENDGKEENVILNDVIADS